MTVCLAIFAVACDPDNSPKSFTITVVDGDNNPVAEQEIGVCQADGACTNYKTDSNGKIVVDTSTDAWKKSKDMHLQFLKLAAGIKGFDADGFIYDKNNGPYVDHHKTSSATLTVKPLTTENNVDVGIELDERGFGGKPVVYAFNADSNSKLMLEGNTNGGTFDTRAYINGADTPVKHKFDANNTSKTYDIPAGGASSKKISVLLIVEPADANSSRFTFTGYAVNEFEYTVVSVSSSALDGSLSYKTYFNLTADTSKIAFGQINDNLAEAIRYPVKVKIGNGDTLTWNSASDILEEYTVTEKGFVPIEFSWESNVDNPFIGIVVKNNDNGGGDTPSDNVLTLGTPVSITIADGWDESNVFTFEVPEAGNYTITFSKANAWINYDYSTIEIKGTSITIGLTMNDGVATAPFVGGESIQITFGTLNSTGDTYTVTITKAA